MQLNSKLRLHSMLLLAAALGLSCSDRTSAEVVLATGSAQQSLTPSGNLPTLTVTSSDNAPNPNEIVNLQLSSSPVTDSGTVTQTLDFTWDPHFVTDEPPLVPENWNTTYYVGVLQLPSTPNSIAGWNAVTRVVAAGSYFSGGVSNGNQYILGNANAITQTPSNFSGGFGGDGWDVFFDPQYNKVYNITHHNGPDLRSPKLMCHNLQDGSACPNYPFPLINTDMRATGYYDAPLKRLWHPTWLDANNTTYTGFECVDLSGSAPASCIPRFVQTQANSNAGLWSLSQAHEVGRELYSFDFSYGELVCLDLDAGAPCAGQPFKGFGGPWTGDFRRTDTKEINGWLYVVNNGNIYCFDPATKAACANTHWPQNSNWRLRPFYPIPDADTVVRNLCLQDECWALDGNQPTVNPNFVAYMRTTREGQGLPDWPNQFGKASASSTKLFFPSDDGWLDCFDFAQNANCANWPVSVPTLYSATRDPLNPNCIWTNGDNSVIHTIDVPTGTYGCKTPPPETIFYPQISMPRLACDANAQISAWTGFTLNNPNTSSFTSASLTIKDSAGNPIPSWQNVAVDNSPLDLSGLTVQQTGQAPAFVLSFTGLTDTSPANASFTVLGAPPQICVTAHLDSICPYGGGLAPTSIDPTSPGDVTGNSNFSLNANAPQPLVPADQAFTALPNITDPNQCSGLLVGQMKSPAGRFVPNMVATLYNGDYTPVLDGSSNPITATSGADGNYAFPPLLTSRYRVHVADQAPWQVQFSLVQAGGGGQVWSSNGTDDSNPAWVRPGDANISSVYFQWYSATADNCQQPNQCGQNVCGSNNICGGSYGDLVCTPQTGYLCQSGWCTGSGSCIPPWGCYIDNECAANAFCNRATFYCTADLANGAPIPNEGLHQGACNGINANNVCVSQACNPNTNTCAGPNGSVCTNANQCVLDVCGSNGACGYANGQGACTAQNTNVICQSMLCGSNGACGLANGDTGCTPANANALCQSQVCKGGACVPSGGCYNDTDCASGTYCNRGTLGCDALLTAGTGLPSDGLHTGVCDASQATAVCASGLCNPNTNTCAAVNGTACTSAGQCVVNLCGNNNFCGLWNGQAGCTAATAGTVCQSSLCSQGNVCIPSSGCYVDADCSGTKYCNRALLRCDPLLAVGTAIPSDGLHAGTCADGSAVCGTHSCNPNTSTCAQANGAVCTDVNQCVSNLCGSNGQCGLADGQAGCTAITGAALCQSTYCSANANHCIPSASSCWVDADCDTSSQFCDRSTTTCLPKLVAGTALPSDGLHDGNCGGPTAQAVCADGQCNDTTLTCGRALNSNCTGAAECVNNICGNNNQCGYANGTGTCDAYHAATVCQSGFCSGTEGVCIGTSTGCFGDGDCANGNYCSRSDEVCKPKQVGGVALPADGLHDVCSNGNNTACESGLCSAASVTCLGVNVTTACAAGAGESTCISGVCGADGFCGHPNAEGPCDNSNVTVVCRSGACSASGYCVPTGPGACYLDSDCDAAAYCDQSLLTCIPQKVGGGAAVPQDGLHTCANGNSYACSTGLCNDSTQTCLGLNASTACVQGAGASTCVSGVCGVDGHCGYRNSEGPCDANNAVEVCRSTACSASGHCVPAAAGACYIDSDCTAPGTYCNQAQLACLPAAAVGGNALPQDGLHDVCDADGNNVACASGICNPKTLTCLGPNGSTACTVANANAACLSGVCGTDGFCGYADGTGSCTADNANTVCRTGLCNLTNYRCGPNPTGPTCQKNTDCADKTWCDLVIQTCLPQLPNGTPISTQSDFGSVCTAELGAAMCVSGVCNTATETCGQVNGTACTDASSCGSGVCHSDGLCGSPSEMECTVNAQCRSGACIEGLCAESDAVTRGTGLFSCSAVSGGLGRSLDGWLFMALALLTRRRVRQRLLQGMRGAAALATVLGLLVGAPANAAGPKGFGLDRFSPSPAGSRWLWADSLVPTETLQPVGFSAVAVRLVDNWSGKPLVIAFDQGRIIGDVVSLQSNLQLGASFYVQENWRFGVEIPVQIFSAGKSLADGHNYVATSSPRAGFGDVQAHAAYLRALEDTSIRYGVTLMGRFPSGSRSAYAGDGTTSGSLALTFAGDHPNVAWSASVGGRLRSQSQFANSTLGSQVFGSAAVGFQTVDRAWLAGLEVPLAGVVVQSPGATGDRLWLEPTLVGAYKPRQDLAIHLGLGSGVTSAVGSPLWRATVSVEYAPQVAAPAPPSAPVEKPALAPAPAPEPIAPAPPPAPAPEVAPAPPVEVVPPPPPPPAPDADGDGVPDASDACPKVAGPADHRGCPADDADGDGVPDAADNCPTEAGTVENQGCSKPQDVKIEGNKIKLMKPVLFATGKDRILEESFALLDQVVALLQQHAELKHILVEGHTDSQGKATSNLDLSNRRAKSVMTYLSSHGLDAARLSSEGFGQTRPIAPNDTAEGRTKNRRVEFTVLP